VKQKMISSFAVIAMMLALSSPSSCGVLVALAP